MTFPTVLLVVLSASCLTTAQEQSSSESSKFPLRPALATQQLQGVSKGSETCSIPEVKSGIEVAFLQFLQKNVVDTFSCGNVILGKYQYCPAANYSQIFSISHIFHFPGYYWIIAENGSTNQVYCDFKSEFSYATAEI